MKAVTHALTSRRAFLGLMGAGSLLLLPSAAMATAKQGRLIKIYKNPACGCCSQWAKILRQNGYETEVIGVNDMTTVKELAGVPAELESCHTAMIDGYVVEGHVPLEEMERMLSERPKIAGIAVPGMPSGSPGMSGPLEPFDVVAFTADGGRGIYKRYN
jgi:hypothetical protein